MMTDIDRAKKTPSEVYERPLDVVSDDDLSREEKIDVLRRWRYDCVQLETAQGENMQSDQRSLLQEVLDALAELGEKP